MKKLLLGLLVILAFPASCTVISIGVFKVLEPDPVTLAADGRVPPSFPVLVLTAGSDGEPRASMVEHGRLAEFLEEHPEHDFRVPTGAAERLNAQLAAGSREAATGAARWAEGVPWRLRFTVEAETGRTQLIRAEKTWDDDDINIGWYEATADEIRPLRHKDHFGAGYALAALPIAVLATVLLWLAGSAGLRLARRRLARTQPSPGPGP